MSSLNKNFHQESINLAFGRTNPLLTISIYWFKFAGIVQANVVLFIKNFYSIRRHSFSDSSLYVHYLCFIAFYIQCEYILSICYRKSNKFIVSHFSPSLVNEMFEFIFSLSFWFFLFVFIFSFKSNFDFIFVFWKVRFCQKLSLMNSYCQNHLPLFNELPKHFRVPFHVRLST